MTNIDYQDRMGAAPTIVVPETVAPGLAVNVEEVAWTSRELGISDIGINETNIYLDPRNRLLNLGTHYPNLIGRLRHRSIPELKGAKGDIIRISTRVRGKERSVESMNRVLVHELEHRAQQERNDAKMMLGHTATLGMTIAGAMLGSRLTPGRSGVVIGAALGNRVGYFLAPHEIQARKRAKQIQTDAIRKT